MLNYVEIFKSVPPEIATIIIAMLPVAELRAAIPIALTVFHFDVVSAIFYSFIGNIIPMFFILYLIDPVSKLLMKYSKFFNKFFTWLFERTRIKFEGKYEKFGSLALIIFVAIPLPVTGCWTGALAAFLFQIPRRKAAFLISLGVFIAAIFVTFLTLTATGAYFFIT